MFKKVEWSILAQCDLFAVKRLVETENRPAMKTVQPLRETIFNRKILKEKKWNDTYEAVCEAYKQLPPNFKIAHDSFCGYRLLYTGKNVVKPPHVFKPSPIGFVKAVPDGVVTDLSVMSSRRTNEQLLLLGPIRFVN